MIGGAVALVTAPELAPAWLALYRAGAAMAITGGAISTVAGFLPDDGKCYRAGAK